MLHVAIIKAKEETGIKNIWPLSKDIISLDVLPVYGHFKEGKYVASHLHISAAYLLMADENEALIAKPDENSIVQWIPLAEICIYSNKSHMKKIYNKIISKLYKIIFFCSVASQRKDFVDGRKSVGKNPEGVAV